jgi:hypothetical protein
MKIGNQKTKVVICLFALAAANAVASCWYLFSIDCPVNIYDASHGKCTITSGFSFYPWVAHVDANHTSGRLYFKWMPRSCKYECEDLAVIWRYTGAWPDGESCSWAPGG